MPKTITAHLHKPGPRGTPLQRFQARVDEQEASDCWPWTGASNELGYGRLYSVGPHRYVAAHRMALAIATGSDPAGVVCHACDNPACCNPNHLYDGTQLDNMADRKRRGRTFRPLARRGLSYQAKPPELVARVQALLDAGHSAQSIAKQLPVSASTVSNIRHGRHWSQQVR